MPHKTCTTAGVVLLSLAVASCNSKPASPSAVRYAGYGGRNYGYGPIEFKDDVRTNVETRPGMLDLAFVDAEGKPVDLRQYRGKKNVVLVVTRGFAGGLCPYCTTQTSRLISSHSEFAKRNAEVLVVFPGPAERVLEFVDAARSQAQAARLPFPVLLDRDFRAVDHLGIRADLAKPSTYIIDREGRVRFAYVGATRTDRPSVKALLKELDALASSPAAGG